MTTKSHKLPRSCPASLWTRCPIQVTAGSLKYQEDMLSGEGYSPAEDDVMHMYKAGTNSAHQLVWSFSWSYITFPYITDLASLRTVSKWWITPSISLFGVCVCVCVCVCVRVCVCECVWMCVWLWVGVCVWVWVLWVGGCGCEYVCKQSVSSCHKWLIQSTYWPHRPLWTAYKTAYLQSVCPVFIVHAACGNHCHNPLSGVVSGIDSLNNYLHNWLWTLQEHQQRVSYTPRIYSRH